MANVTWAGEEDIMKLKDLKYQSSGVDVFNREAEKATTLKQNHS